MSTPILHLRQITDQLTAMHRTGDGIAGRLLLRGEGLVPGRPEALPPVAEFFAIGAVGPMAETAMRLNREPGRNVRVSPKVCSVDLGADVLGTLGFGLALRDANAETWVQRVPYGPTTAFGEPNDAANGKNVYTIWLFDHPEPEAAVAPVADYIAGVAGGVVAEDWPVVGSLNYPAVGEPELVQLLLPWQQTCSLDQLRELIEAEKRARRFRMDAEDPDDSGKSEDRKPGKASTATAAAGDDMTVALAELSRVLYRRYRSIEVGSDVEVSQKISRELTARFGKIVWDEGAFWLYEERAGCWKMMGPEAVRRLLHSFDGAIYPTATGKPETMRLSKGRIDSVVHELAAILAEPHFFETAAAGINITSGFIHFDRLGTPGCCRTRPIIAAVMSSLATGARSSTMSPKTRPPTQSSINCSTAVFVTIPMPSRKRCWSPRSAAPRLPGWPPGCHSPRLRSFSGRGRIMENPRCSI